MDLAGGVGGLYKAIVVLAHIPHYSPFRAFEKLLSLCARNQAKPGEQVRKMSYVTNRNLGAVDWALTSLIKPQDLGFFPFSGHLASFPEFSVEGWMRREEHKGAIKKCQVMVNKSYSVCSQEVQDPGQ